MHIWKTDGTHKSTIPGHCGPIKGVRWIEITGSSATFARYLWLLSSQCKLVAIFLNFWCSVSHDQTVMLWKMNLETYAIECVHIGRGHERSIECVDVDKNASFLATGGWDNMLKIWAASKNPYEKNFGF